MIITSRKNELIVKSRGLLNEKKFRDKYHLFAAEGFKLAEEAINAGIELEYALISTAAEKKFFKCVELLRKKCRIYLVDNEIYSYLSGQKSPQGIFIAGKLLDKFQNIDRIVKKNKILILDSLQDSGNLGTILRTAEALGIDGAVLGMGCADVWSPKTLRASMGSVFRMPLCVCELSKAVEDIKENGFKIYAAMLDERAKALGTFKFPPKTAVIIGNEGHGIAEEIVKECEKLYIPIFGAESLNAAAAAAVICWEIYKNRGGESFV